MICRLIGHDFVNEVQTVVQVFFPGEKFQCWGGNEAAVCDGFVTQGEHPYTCGNTGLIITTEMTKTAAIAQVHQNDTILAEHSMPTIDLPAHLSPRRVLMLAIYHTLQTIKPTNTPWGALTGIRPSKMVREWLQNGYSDKTVLATMQDPFCCTPEKAHLALEVAKAEQALTTRIYETTTNPIAIYISIPFCPTRCLYCSFNTAQSYANRDIHANYISAIIHECKTQAARLRELGGRVSSIYIGGGTPTVLSDYLLEKLLDTVRTIFIEHPVEFTIEAGRPDSLTQSNLRIMHCYGANRIAVNPQTLNDNTLQTIGRNHTAASFFRAFHQARDTGFDCINTDIIAALPSETPDDMRRTMEGLAPLSPENITVHTLARKRASRLNESIKDACNCSNTQNKANITLPAAHCAEEMLQITNATCTAAGLLPYYLYRQKNMVGMLENVGYSKLGHECLYNVGMMAETQSVLGIGAGAVSKFVEGEKISREFNVKNAEIYIERTTRR